MIFISPFFYFRYSNFSPDFFGCDVKRLILKIYDAINWETYGYNTILPNISRSKSNQTMKFGLLIEYEKVFSKYQIENVVEKLAPDHFL